MTLFGTNAPYFGFTASTGGLNNNQTACLAASLILPIELISLTANCSDGSVKVDWATASEINNDYFTLERSADGVNFEELTIVSGAGNSNNIVSYSWLDDNPTSDIAYYRLKQTDFNGAFSYSEIISKNCQSNDEFRVYPNPVLNRLTLSGSSEKLMDYKIISIEGKILKAGAFIGESQLDISNLSEGVYLVELISDIERFREKLIKR